MHVFIAIGSGDVYTLISEGSKHSTAHVTSRSQ